jgi:hypothetical protein
MGENKNVCGKVPWTFLFFHIPSHKCLREVSIDISIDIFIFKKECGKIKMSMECFRRHFYLSPFLASNVYGKFP